MKQLLDKVIDLPARQVFIEGMVLEIDLVALEELGVQWEYQEGKFDFLVGSLTTDLIPLAAVDETVSILVDSTTNLKRRFIGRLQALITEGKAEILSRPSVLTLNNRQATIRVGQDIPIATSQKGISSDSSKISFDFRYVPLGILLNIRPRVSNDGTDISMMIDTSVSSRVPEADLEIRDEEGNLLASAPTVNTRRVQTYARISNNTPFIIGGLVSRQTVEIVDKVPFLGDIPIIQHLFRLR